MAQSDARASGRFLNAAYQLLMRRNSVYIMFIFVGAMVGERVVDYTFNKIWEMNNMGKRYEDIPTLGSRVTTTEE